MNIIIFINKNNEADSNYIEYSIDIRNGSWIDEFDIELKVIEFINHIISINSIVNPLTVRDIHPEASDDIYLIIWRERIYGSMGDWAYFGEVLIEGVSGDLIESIKDRGIPWIMIWRLLLEVYDIEMMRGSLITRRRWRMILITRLKSGVIIIYIIIGMNKILMIISRFYWSIWRREI
jgi:hypothetical protein